MTADVYAGDDPVRRESPAPPVSTRVTFTVNADADPDVLARVANQLAIGNVAPTHVKLMRPEPAVVLIRADVDGLSSSTTELIRRKLLQLTSVTNVKVERATESPCDYDHGDRDSRDGDAQHQRHDPPSRELVAPTDSGIVSWLIGLPVGFVLKLLLNRRREA
jgi:hypothetical protein